MPKPLSPAARVGCRAFQKAFHVAIPLLPYRKPFIVDELIDIPTVLEYEGCHRPLIVTDPTVSQLGLARTLELALQVTDTPYSVYNQVVANPTTETVAEANPLYPVPVLMSAEELETIYEQLLEEGR